MVIVLPHKHGLQPVLHSQISFRLFESFSFHFIDLVSQLKMSDRN